MLILSAKRPNRLYSADGVLDTNSNLRVGLMSSLARRFYFLASMARNALKFGGLTEDLSKFEKALSKLVDLSKEARYMLDPTEVQIADYIVKHRDAGIYIAHAETNIDPVLFTALRWSEKLREDGAQYEDAVAQNIQRIKSLLFESGRLKDITDISTSWWACSALLEYYSSTDIPRYGTKKIVHELVNILNTELLQKAFRRIPEDILSGEVTYEIYRPLRSRLFTILNINRLLPTINKLMTKKALNIDVGKELQIRLINHRNSILNKCLGPLSQTKHIYFVSLGLWVTQELLNTDNICTRGEAEQAAKDLGDLGSRIDPFQREVLTDYVVVNGELSKKITDIYDWLDRNIKLSQNKADEFLAVQRGVLVIGHSRSGKSHFVRKVCDAFNTKKKMDELITIACNEKNVDWKAFRQYIKGRIKDRQNKSLVYPLLLDDFDTGEAAEKLASTVFKLLSDQEEQYFNKQDKKVFLFITGTFNSTAEFIDRLKRWDTVKGAVDIPKRIAHTVVLDPPNPSARAAHFMYYLARE